MAGMRDRLIHGYFGVDYGIVWDNVSFRQPCVTVCMRGGRPKGRNTFYNEIPHGVGIAHHGVVKNW